MYVQIVLYLCSSVNHEPYPMRNEPEAKKVKAKDVWIEQIEQFLSASAPIEFSASGNDSERYRPISRVLKRFDYAERGKRDRSAAEVLATYEWLQPGAGDPSGEPMAAQPLG
jgi:hypothetical protein